MAKKRPASKRVTNKNNITLVQGLKIKKLHLNIFIVLFAIFGSYMVFNSFAANNNAPPRPFVDVPERGLIWAGLKAPQAGGPCGELFEVANVRAKRPLCTHGPDPAPEGIDVSKKGEPIQTGDNITDTDSASTLSAAAAFACEGDGTSGNRVQGLYVRASDVPSRHSTLASSLQIYATRANSQYQRSAAETGSERNIRWVHDANCNPVIPEVVIPPAGDDSFNASINALVDLGHDRGDRKYMLWVDAEVYCGIGTIFADDRPGGENHHNNGLYATYARSDSGCWNYAEAHELMHNLGGVQPSAPHATPGWHCTDESDEMCYVDGSGVVMTNTCVGRDTTLFDCNHDDYFYAGTPPITNYLSNHWNTANSSFLIGGITSVPVQCNNARDDDGDGKVDYPADPGCASSVDTSESPDPVAPGDTTAPTVSIVSPKSNAIVKRQVGISANGFDNIKVTKMQIYVDLGLKASSSGTPISFTWNTNKNVSPGAHTITVKAWDAAGNMGQSSITVIK